jgi:[citrate (pro-3S)-lyase] ligase
METLFGRPLSGELLCQTMKFLHECGLDYENDIEFTVDVVKNDEIVATGSRQRNVLKCIAVSPKYRGTGLLSDIMTNLVGNAIHENITHLFLYTGPKNQDVFASLGFYPVARTDDVILMENVKDGVRKFVKSLECPAGDVETGCIVANANPFTNGHLYLAETAAQLCDFVHLFILSEERSEFSADARLLMAKRAVASLSNVIVHPTGNYLVSTATFPDYFVQDKKKAKAICGELDLAVFVQQFAGPLHITRRFVGSEPFSHVTEKYNETMKRLLPRYGIKVNVVPRLERNGTAISAGGVRQLLEAGNMRAVRELVPVSIYQYLEGRCHNGI